MYNRPFRSLANSAGRYDSTVVITNRRRIGRDGTTYAAQGVDRSRLLFARQSETSLADWYADSLTGIIEIRIPWGMLNVVDPSSHLVLRGANSGEVGATATDGFRFLIESYDPSRPTHSGDRMPKGTTPGTFAIPSTWTWPSWEEPRWYAEIKPQFETMRRTFADIPNAPAKLDDRATRTAKGGRVP